VTNTTSGVVPHLGDSSATFHELLGAPRLVQSHGAGIVRVYRCDGAELLAIFDRNRAVGVYGASTSGAARHTPIDTLIRRVGSTAPGSRLFRSGDGLIAVRARCPRATVNLLRTISRTLHLTDQPTTGLEEQHNRRRETTLQGCPRCAGWLHREPAIAVDERPEVVCLQCGWRREMLPAATVPATTNSS